MDKDGYTTIYKTGKKKVISTNSETAVEKKIAVTETLADGRVRTLNGEEVDMLTPAKIVKQAGGLLLAIQIFFFFIFLFLYFFIFFSI